MVTPPPLVLFVVVQHPERGPRVEAQHHHQANAARHLRSLGQPQPRRSCPSRGLRALRVSVLSVTVYVELPVVGLVYIMPFFVCGCTSMRV